MCGIARENMEPGKQGLREERGRGRRLAEESGRDRRWPRLGILLSIFIGEREEDHPPCAVGGWSRESGEENVKTNSNLADLPGILPVVKVIEQNSLFFARRIDRKDTELINKCVKREESTVPQLSREAGGGHQGSIQRPSDRKEMQDGTTKFANYPGVIFHKQAALPCLSSPGDI